MIPHYQEASLQGENVAKRRVMQRAKKGFESEEQRAIRSGQVIDELKTGYRTIVQNLQMQLTTMQITKSTIESIVASLDAGRPTIMSSGEFIEGDENIVQGNLHSLLIGTLGKLVNLASQCKLLCSNLSEKVRDSGKPVTGSADLSKINSLFVEVADAFGGVSETGLSKGLAQMLDELEFVGGSAVPNIKRLASLYVESMSDAATIIEKLQRNEYDTDLQKVLIPSKSTSSVRQSDVLAGRERREFSGEEYKLLVALREQGLLSGDDFTSVYSGSRGDDSTISSSGSSSGRVFRPFRLTSETGVRAPQRFDPRLGTISDDDAASYQQGFDSDDDTVSFREPDSDDDSDYGGPALSGNGLYSIPASARFPLRTF